MSELNKNMNKAFVLSYIKNKYILRQVFNNLQQKKLLEIIRYNKELQNKLNKSIYDYKLNHFKIEIELTLIENKEGKFINMHTKKNKNYFYHIFFNNNNEEIKRNYIIK